MAVPKKVRIFRDPKKSPNWYVEWRDAEGRRHSESCGPARRDALRRAKQLHQEMQAARLATLRSFAGSEGNSNQTTPTLVSNVLRLPARINLGECEVPVEISVEISPALLNVIEQAISGFRVGDGGTVP
jgi:hypothetical protein